MSKKALNKWLRENIGLFGENIGLFDSVMASLRGISKERKGNQKLLSPSAIV